MNTIHYDALIIGFGKGGKTIAQDMARLGKKVALIEKSPMMYGGTCINIGCIPTKSLVHNALFAQQHPDWDFEQKAAFYKKSITEEQELTAFLRQKNYALLANNPRITVITGFASFESPNEVAVTTPEGDSFLITAQHIIVNTGSKEHIPHLKGFDSGKVFTSTTMLNDTVLPQRLCIIGGGYIGFEFASMYASFGSQVTVLESASVLLAREDRDIATAVQASLEKKGIRFVCNAETQEIVAEGQQRIIVYKDRLQQKNIQIEADAVLVAVGRRPMTEGLHPENAGLELTVHGGIRTNEYLTTSQPHIYALGDVVGRQQFTYISLDDSRIVMDALFGSRQKSTLTRLPVPYSVFIDPPLSHLGMTEHEAREQHIDYKVATLQAAAIPRARLMRQTDGMLKMLINKHDDKIIGCTLFCADSHEMINIVRAAIKADVDYRFLRDFIFTHPTMSESLNDLCKQLD